MRGVASGHVKCVPKWRVTLMFALVRAVPGRVCKIADDSRPGVRILDLPPIRPGQACAETRPG